MKDKRRDIIEREVNTCEFNPEAKERRINQALTELSKLELNKDEIAIVIYKNLSEEIKSKLNGRVDCLPIAQAILKAQKEKRGEKR